MDDGLILCPACHVGLPMVDAASAKRVACASCAVTYSAENGVLDLLPKADPSRSLAQKLSDARIVVRFYEGWLGRRSPLFAMVMGISLRREQELVLGVAGLRGDEVVLDLACGPGLYTRLLARSIPSGAVVGLDISTSMLAYAATRARGEGLHNIRWIHGTAEDLPFRPASFDLVLCYGALHLFPDVGKALRSIAALLRPGQRFIFGTFRRGQGALWNFRAWVFQQFGIEIFSGAALAKQLEGVGFEDVQIHHDRARYLIMSARACQTR